MYFWDDADWVLPEAAPATRYIYRHRLNYVIRSAILLASLLWAAFRLPALEDPA